MAPYWEDKFLRTIGYQERVSTRNSLANTLHRHMLDKHFFHNDPDVFLLRDGVPKVNENKLSPLKRHTLYFLNNLLGGLVFLSDHVREYTPEQKAQLAEMFPSLEAEITRFDYQGELYTIEFQVEEREYVALVNLSPKPAPSACPQASGSTKSSWSAPAICNPTRPSAQPRSSPRPSPLCLGAAATSTPAPR